MEWLIGILIYIILVFLQIAWEYRGNIQRFIKRKEKIKQEEEKKDFYQKGNKNMTNKIYDKLKFVAQILLPAIGTLYFGIASIWGLPYAKEIVGTITAIDLFLGTMLGISTISYNKEIEEDFEEELVVINLGE